MVSNSPSSAPPCTVLAAAAAPAPVQAQQNLLRVFFIPVYASGHILPLCDLAVLMARLRPGQLQATMVVTPANAPLLHPIIRRSSSPVNLLTYPFPSDRVGLPLGIENIASARSQPDSWKVMAAVDHTMDTLGPLLRLHRPDAIVADAGFTWTADVAAELGIPHITFRAVGVFAKCVMTAFFQHQQHQQKQGDVDPMKEVVTVPGLKPEIRIPMSELPEFLRDPEDPVREGWRLRSEMQRSQSYGVVVNTFYGLEQAYCDLFRRAHCQRAWFVGPVSLANTIINNNNNALNSGNDALDDECLRWLDGREEEGSVVFICLGSWCSLSEEQTREMARGLESSGVPFLWAVRSSTSEDQECNKYWTPLPEDPEWEERVTARGRGMVARGWVPQVAILGHRAVGAFLTHCGWNSTLEAAAAGVPVLTWPLAFEQFINERLVVDVAGAGERLSEGFRSERVEERVVVPGEAIAEAVSGFMGRRKQRGDPVRERARRCGEMARAAVEEGGSSRRDVDEMIEELMKLAAERKRKGKEGAGSTGPC